MSSFHLGSASLDRMPAIADADMTAEQKAVMDEIAAEIGRASCRERVYSRV
jgi:hypothetical protein